jgi:lysophospholipase L1-like esterase
MTGAAPSGLQVIFRGDSITAGVGAPAGLDYVSRIERRLAPRRIRCIRLAAPGETAADIAARAAAAIDPLHYGRGRSLLVLLAGTNDLFAGEHGEAVAAAIADCCRGRRARGFAVIAATLPPHGATADPARLERERQALNARLRAGWREFADALADPGGDPVLGDPARVGDPTLFADRVHPAAAGHATIARHVGAALERLLRVTGS